MAASRLGPGLHAVLQPTACTVPVSCSRYERTAGDTVIESYAFTVAGKLAATSQKSCQHRAGLTGLQPTSSLLLHAGGRPEDQPGICASQQCKRARLPVRRRASQVCEAPQAQAWRPSAHLPG